MIDRALQRQWGRIGGLRLAASRDPREYTAPARQRFLLRFYSDIPEDLPVEERDRRATARHVRRTSHDSRSRRRVRGNAPKPPSGSSRHDETAGQLLPTVSAPKETDPL